jgi:hypothetical protein
VTSVLALSLLRCCTGTNKLGKTCRGFFYPIRRVRTQNTPAPAAGATESSPVDLVRHLLQRYLALKPYEYVGIALWIVHTHVFSRFVITPRLALTSPVRGCGKTTVLAIAEALVARARKADGITAAAIYRLVDQEHPTLLVDEADNLDLQRNGALRAVFNSGHRRGGSVMRYIGTHASRSPPHRPRNRVQGRAREL